jgi:hypothetical protein
MKQFDPKKLGLEFESSLKKVLRAMYELEYVLEQYEGMEDIICDGFPFSESYDEQVASVHAWWEQVAEKVDEMGRGE